MVAFTRGGIVLPESCARLLTVVGIGPSSADGPCMHYPPCVNEDRSTCNIILIGLLENWIIRVARP